MADTKPHPEQQIKVIHDILDEYDGEEALRRIRAVLYGEPDEEEGEPEEPEGKEVD